MLRSKKLLLQSVYAPAPHASQCKKPESVPLTYHSFQERKEAEAWTDKDVKNSKAAKEAKEEKRKADLARKAENARLLAEEEAGIRAKVTAVPKAGQKKKAEAVRPAGPGAIAAGGGLPAVSGSGSSGKGKEEEPESFAATGIDNALELLEVVTAKMDKASVGQQAAGLERHPEVCWCFLLLLDM